MDDLPMPSDVRRDADAGDAAQSLPEAPGGKMVVRLFLIPAIIVAVAVGIMVLIGSLAGSPPTMEEALERLKKPGGERTGGWMVGPASKQRYMDAKALTDRMKAGMTEAERVYLAAQLVEILRKHTRADEGEVQHFVLLALGRVWQIDPGQGEMNTPEAVASRRETMNALLDFSRSEHLTTRKAAILAIVYWAGRAEVADAMPVLIEKVRDEREDVDVRIAAATVIGPVGSADDEPALEALRFAMRETDPHKVELVWSAALSLAQLDQHEVKDTILQLLSRPALAGFRYYDRETDPQNPQFRGLSDREMERILVNTLIGARNLLDDAEIRSAYEKLAESDHSPRVRMAAKEYLPE